MSGAAPGSADARPAGSAEPDQEDRSDASALPIAGLSRLSSCDWPGRLVATVFVQGCPWRCGYCHNQDLIDPRTPGAIRWSAVTHHLDRRRGLLDGVVFSGGEPTRAPQLAAAMAEVRERGYLVGLHTSGAYPHRLPELLGLVNWVGLDIKGLPQQYLAITERRQAAQQAFDSLDRVLNSGVDYEVRITVDPRYHDAATVTELLVQLQQRGASTVVLQPVRRDRAGATAAAVALLDQVAVPAGVSRR